MELSQVPTKPTIRSTVSFTQKEVVQALIGYAQEQGYSFAVNADYSVWFPDHRSGLPERVTTLAVEVDGVDPAITKGSE